MKESDADMTEILKVIIYFISGTVCYIFVAHTAHIEMKKMLRFVMVLALFMSVLLMSPVYRSLWTPYILIFWPYEFGVMLYMCDSVDKETLSLKRIAVCVVLVCVAIGVGAFMQTEPVSVKSAILHVMPACMGVVTGIARRIVNACFA